MKKASGISLTMAVLLLGLISSLLVPASPRAQQSTAPIAPALVTQEKEACIRNLKLIYEAIQAYRKDRKDLPDWLSVLVPRYIADTRILICPTTVRTGETRTMVYGDPKLVSSYIYEFSSAKVNGTPQMTMKQWKRKQMGLLGSVVPLVRCHTHHEALNLAFDGSIYSSTIYWENNFTNLVSYDDLMPWGLLAIDQRAKPDEPGISTGQAARTTERNAPSPNRGDVEAAITELLGKPAPNFKLDLLEGGQFELAAHKDKNIVILDFWATWCGPCRAALPVMAELAAEYKSKGVAYYAVDLREPPEKVRGYLSASGLKPSVPMDKDGAVGKLYKVSGIPALVIVGKDGTVQVIQVGFSPELKEQLKRKLNALLAGENLAAGARGK